MTSSSARRWFVTGASIGMGRALIVHALAGGVITTVRNSRVLRNLESHFLGSLEVEMLDVRDRDAINTTVEKVLPRGAVGAVAEITRSLIDDQIVTLLHGPVAVTRAFLPSLRDPVGGDIIQIVTALASKAWGGRVTCSHSCWPEY